MAIKEYYSQLTPMEMLEKIKRTSRKPGEETNSKSYGMTIEEINGMMIKMYAGTNQKTVKITATIESAPQGCKVVVNTENGDPPAGSFVMMGVGAFLVIALFVYCILNGVIAIPGIIPVGLIVGGAISFSRAYKNCNTYIDNQFSGFLCVADPADRIAGSESVSPAAFDAAGDGRLPGPSEWKCPKCGKINQNYVGTCGCGETKPR